MKSGSPSLASATWVCRWRSSSAKSADPAEAFQEYCVTPVAQPPAAAYDAIVIAVAHRQFKELGGQGIRAFGKPLHVLYDLKCVLSAQESDLRL